MRYLNNVCHFISHVQKASRKESKTCKWFTPALHTIAATCLLKFSIASFVKSEFLRGCYAIFCLQLYSYLLYFILLPLPHLWSYWVSLSQFFISVFFLKVSCNPLPTLYPNPAHLLKSNLPWTPTIHFLTDFSFFQHMCLLGINYSCSLPIFSSVRF